MQQKAPVDYRLRLLFGWMLLGWISACQLPSFSVEGKECSAEDPCPSSYACVPGADGQRCRQQGAGGAACETPLFIEDFESYHVGTAWQPNQTLGPWKATYIDAPRGTASIIQTGTSRALLVGDYAALFTVASFGDFDLTVKLKTLVSSPNDYDVAWLFWHAQDLNRFYKVTLQYNGWHMERRSNRTQQDFPLDGRQPVFPIGVEYRVRVRQVGGLMDVFVDDALLFSYSDPNPFLDGSLVLGGGVNSTFDDLVVCAAAPP